MKILIRGGSIAAGFGVSRGYPEILKNYYRPRGIEILNRSRTGDTSFSGVETYYDDIAPDRPDALIIHFGTDDAFSAVYRSEFKENLIRMIRLSRSEFDTRIFLPTSHLFELRHEMEAVEIFYRAIREVCLDLDCVLIPAHTYWAGQLMEQGIPNAELLQADSRYPNGKGHAIFAEVILRTLDCWILKDSDTRGDRPVAPF